jgi:hypothetical protein
VRTNRSSSFAPRPSPLALGRVSAIGIKTDVLAYNLTRVMNIMGIQPLIAAMGVPP